MFGGPGAYVGESYCFIGAELLKLVEGSREGRQEHGCVSKWEGTSVQHPQPSSAPEPEAAQLPLRDEGYSIRFNIPDLDLIKDKSNSSRIGKTIVVLQVGWFVLQSGGRRAQNLPFATLEITALAFVACTIVTYIMWWGKPLDIETPEYIECHANEKEAVDEALSCMGIVYSEHTGGPAVSRRVENIGSHWDRTTSYFTLNILPSGSNFLIPSRSLDSTWAPNLLNRVINWEDKRYDYMGSPMFFVLSSLVSTSLLGTEFFLHASSYISGGYAV